MISIFNAPFQVGFYNTTPNAYTLALRVGLQRSEQLFRWVWEANRGNPVGENATFSLGVDGNLVLANADGRIVWQTNTSNKGVVAFRIIGRPVNNSTLTYLRLGIDGNIKFHTYFLDVRDGVWKVTYTLFDRDFDESECQLPERCGKFGLCEDNQCVGCPLENGIFGWSNKCSPKPLGVCKESEFHYYKIEGVEHYMSKYTIGDRVSEANCGNKCTKDCKCVGYFYHKDNSRCWIAYDLQTLTKVANTTHVGYVKVPNK
ncbi:epidermis-specific secreted glycoprotein ep1-like [Trifolium pratense]|uniref:Epidermis-specific secreted glycoprotein ep1-like n=1 Tax=Trifolium pratense TaxID=57577 RepID=A0A2K3N545_TRIPR|nr:epidermis-specific secreted glycoprotein ep1-like [Trifolium pratense]PNX98170.1 epidermis-specific secreted glycoprotein ep1-like [Trifolium pratense]